MDISLGLFISGIVFCQKLRNYAKTQNFSKLEKLFNISTLVCIALMVAGFSFQTNNIANWTWEICFLALIYYSIQQMEYAPLRMFIYAFLPLAIIYLIIHLTQTISLDFYYEWKTFFSYAKGFSYIWLFVIVYNQNRQLKIAEQDRIKRQKADELNRAIALRKVELEELVAERTVELTQQKTALENTLSELKNTQTQLIQSEKMASLGELTAGIAHEIQNPLNFVNNFSEVNKELLEEMKVALANNDLEEVNEIANNIIVNEEKINYHGKRADSIVKGMLQHSRNSTEVKEATDINALCDEYLRLCYHGLRAKDKSFNATIKTDFDNNVGKINVIPQNIGRVVMNILTNAFYAASLPHHSNNGELNEKHDPKVCLTTKKIDHVIMISVSDNGPGIPQHILPKIFQPFFTTKPTGKGTGLGLSLSYEIITKEHNGELKVETKEGQGTTFIIILPL